MSFSRSVLVTGGTSGLGYHAAHNIAKQHPEYLVVVASRSDRESAATSINQSLKQENVFFLPLDLGSLQNVRAFAKTWASKNFAPIQLLLLNAGLQFPEEVRMSEDNIEATFAINHVGHALLFHLLYPHLSSDARIVVTASGTHDPAQNSGLPDAKYTTAEELAHPTPESAKNAGRQRYATSKLVNVMWTYALHRRFQALYTATNGQKNLTVAAFDPGLMPGTGLAREAGPALKFVWNKAMPKLIPVMRKVISPNIHRPEESGASLAWLAMTAGKEEADGKYFEARKAIASSVESREEGKQEDLWAWTVKNVAVNEEERMAFDI